MTLATKKKISALFCGAALIAMTSCGSQKMENSSSTLAGNDDYKVVCDASNLPAGWVIVSHTLSSGCPDVRTKPSNAFGIKKADWKEVVCLDSPIPANYVKTGVTKAVACGPVNVDNAYWIERVR